MVEKLRAYIKEVFEMDSFVESYKSAASFQSKLNMQILTAVAFLILSVANILSRSYTMLVLTALGCVVNVVFAFIANKLKRGALCAFSAIVTCSMLFAFFVIYGGNDGFAALWVVLLPLLSMVAMNFKIGLCASAFFQVFLMVVFWTPLREKLFYRYNDQFCLRFPLFFFVTFVLGLMLTISLRRSEYNDYMHLHKLEEMTATAQKLARTDPLTELANRRYANEEFESKYSGAGRPHCVVIGDIDDFKGINDAYGHDFGDAVLITLSKYMQELLPQDYLKARWGGEEFLLAANAPMAEVHRHVESLREAIAEHEFRYNGAPVFVTITFGIAEYSSKDELSRAIRIADARLYNGKKSTKNCTVAEG